MKIEKIRTKLDNQDPEPITIPRVPEKEEDHFTFFPTPVRGWCQETEELDDFQHAYSELQQDKILDFS